MARKTLAYRCPVASCHAPALAPKPGGLACPNGHFFPYVERTEMPVFEKLADDANEYAHAESAEKHDNALRWVLDTFGTDEASLRESLVARLALRPGATVLVTGAGVGNDLPYIARHLGGRGEIYAQDIAQQMLLTGIERHGAELARAGVAVHFSVSDATNLPFGDATFDAAYHFGGINLFSNIQRGIAEMNRVVKAGGRVVIGDEGLAPWLRDTELGEMLVNNNALYGFEAPLAKLPATVRSPRLSWELCNTFYVIEFDAAHEPLPVDVDVPHVGTRGGSIRKRYSGRLEGIDPKLRDEIYAEAQRRGVSRVELLESVLREALSRSGGGKDGR